MTREPNAWPEPYEHRTKAADPTTGWPGRGERVKILDGFDRYAGEIGVVQRVTFDAGELVLDVCFDDGGTGTYWADQVLMRR